MKNDIQDWLNADKNLYDLIIEIQSTEKNPFEQAEIAFNRLCRMYDLPKMPVDIEKYESYYEENGIDDPRSVFEELTLLKFMEPDDDPRGLVLSSIYHVRNNIGVDYQDITEKEFGKKIPENCQIGIKGEGLNGEVIFPQKEGKSWFDLGCIVNTKLI